MAPEPTGDVEIPDDILDQAVKDSWDDETEPTAAPEPTPTGDPAEEAGVDPDQAREPAEAAAGEARPADVVETRPAPVAAVPAIPAGAKPFQFKASGQVQALPGAHELPDGSVLVTKDALPELRRTFANERDLSVQFKQYRRETDRRLRDAQTARTQKDAEADAVTSLMGDLLRMSPEQQFDYLTQLQGNVPRLTLDLERKKLDEQRKAFEQQQRGPQLTEDEQQEQVADLVTGELSAEWAKIASHPDLQLLTDQERQTVRERWANRPDLLVRTIRTKEEAQQYGGAVGDRLFDPTEFYKDLNFVIGVKKQAAPKPQSKAAEANATRNADRRPTTNAIPPTPRAAAPTGQARDRNGQFAKGDEGRKEWKKDFMREDEGDAA